MAEKIVTFREMEHKRYLKDVFTVLFVVACGVPLAQGLFALPVTGLFKNIEEMTPLLCALKTFVGLLYRGIGTLLVFLLFQMIKYRTPGRYFVKADKKPTAVSVFLTSAASVGLGGGVYLLSALFENNLMQSGYVFIEPWVPSLVENAWLTEVVFVVSVALIPTLFYEIAFRGIVMNAIRDDHLGFAVLISAMLCAGSYVSLSVTPALFVSALVCGYGYAKTESRLVSCLASALTGGTVAVLSLVKEEINVAFAALFLGIGGICGVLLLCCLSQKKKKNKLSAKDGAKAFFGSFAMWIFVLLILFIFLVFNISKPKPETGDSTPTQSNASEIQE